MTIQNILANFLDGSTCPLVCLLVVLVVVGLAGGLVYGYAYLMRKYGKQMAAFLLSVALFSAVVADKSGTNAPPNGVSGTNVVEQTNQMENGKWIMDNVGGLSAFSILHFQF